MLPRRLTHTNQNPASGEVAGLVRCLTMRRANYVEVEFDSPGSNFGGSNLGAVVSGARSPATGRLDGRDDGELAATSASSSMPRTPFLNSVIPLPRLRATSG